ncbi:hypothetical protein LCGC14_1272660 [marine sediment metagenome]|uniref:Uncharacterized protein n=1 Tax=marine sediment metagenome TaxID=412755 RepID=A0A0F9KZG3_9ZZZZ
MKRMSTRFNKGTVQWGFNLPNEEIPTEGRLFSRDEVVNLIREDVAIGGYELGDIEWLDDMVMTFTTLRDPKGNWEVIAFQIPPNGIWLKMQGPSHNFLEVQQCP